MNKIAGTISLCFSFLLISYFSFNDLFQLEYLWICPIILFALSIYFFISKN